MAGAVVMAVVGAVVSQWCDGERIVLGGVAVGVNGGEAEEEYMCVGGGAVAGGRGGCSKCCTCRSTVVYMK